MTRFTLAALLLVAAGCDSSDEDSLRVSLQPGSESRYDVTYVEDRADGQVRYLGDARIRAVADGETVEGITGLTRLFVSNRIDSPDGVFTVTSTAWYRDRDDRLEEVAYASDILGGGAGGLKRGMRQQVVGLFGLDPASSAKLDSTTLLRTPPRIVVEYDAESGDTWRHFDTEGFVSSDRRRGDERTVETAAGTFDCVEVETTYSQNLGIVWTDCIGVPGIVERRISYTGVPDTGGGSGDGQETWTLRAFTPGAAKR